jgi:hypothetical protein
LSGRFFCWSTRSVPRRVRSYDNTMLKKSSALFAAALMMIGSTRVFAWGREGHQIVAKIADLRLSPAAHEAVAELLGDQSMADVASWADDLRRDRKETGPWHYVDIPDDQQTFDAARDGHNGNNVIDKLTEFANAITDQSLTRQQRVDALKFLIHFCGDIAQPLHCTERDHDKGGNDVRLFLLDEPRMTNLHGVWDYGILGRAMGNTPITVYASALNVRITRAEARDWAQGTPESWAVEAHKVAHDSVYDGVPPTTSPPQKLDQAYVDRSIPIVNMQLQKGGVRLARILNQAFRNNSATSQPISAVTRPFGAAPGQGASTRTRRQPATAPAVAPAP